MISCKVLHILLYTHSTVQCLFTVHVRGYYAEETTHILVLLLKRLRSHLALYAYAMTQAECNPPRCESDAPSSPPLTHFH